MIKSVRARRGARAGPAEIDRRDIVTRGDGRPPESSEVVVTGPGEDPDALGQRWLATAGTPSGVA